MMVSVNGEIAHLPPKSKCSTAISSACGCVLAACPDYSRTGQG